MGLKKEKQDRITTWLQRSYYLIAIVKELDLWESIKAVINEWFNS